jgi:hypothetical protein
MDKRETEQLLIQASAIDSRRVIEPVVIAWQAILADITYADAQRALVQHRRDHPSVYLEPGHIVQQVRIARQRHQEVYGIHPPPPLGQRWAVQAIEDMPDDISDAYELRS